MEAVICRYRRKADFAGVVEDRGRQSSTKINVKSDPLTISRLRGKADDSLADATCHAPTLLDGIERLRMRAATCGHANCRRKKRRHVSWPAKRTEEAHRTRHSIGVVDFQFSFIARSELAEPPRGCLPARAHRDRQPPG